MSRQEKNERSKQKILKAAIEEFGKNDYAVASTNSMCKNHGISKGLLFHYFKSKEEVFLACVKMCLEALVDYMETHYKKKEDTIEVNLNNYFEVRHTFFQNEPAYYYLFRSATMNAPENLKGDIAVLKEPLIKLNRSILGELLEAKHLKEGVTNEEVITVVLNFSEYLMMRQSDREEDVLNQEMIRFIKMLFYGVIKMEGEER